MSSAEAVDQVMDDELQPSAPHYVPILPSGPAPSSVVMLSGLKFLLACTFIAGVLMVISRSFPLPVWLLALEVLSTILGLFLFGSFKYQIHKNALTYGMLLIAIATFSGLRTSDWHVEIAQHGWSHWAQQHVLSFRGLDNLVHADTMLFILGLTFFVSVIAQTRLLEGITFYLLRRNQGAILPTVISVTAVVAFTSGILDGVSMIGLTIRTLVIILMLAAAPTAAVRYAVMVCTTVTTICGVWLAYGEPPNLIMKANLYPLLGNAFFLLYCAPIAVVSYLVMARHLRKQLRGQHVDLAAMDVVDANAEDVRFLQAARHGEVLTPVELVEDNAAELGATTEPILHRLRSGDSLGIALVREHVPEVTRKKLLGHFVSEDLADSLDRHYVLDAAGDHEGALRAEKAIDDVLPTLSRVRRRAQIIGALALIPFVGLLIAHGAVHSLPLFPASLAAFAVALFGIAQMPKMLSLALREARREYAEYYFLFPLFLSITLLTSAGFFSQVARSHCSRDRCPRSRARGLRAIPRMHVPLRHPRQQCRRRLRLARSAPSRPAQRLPLRHGADRRLRSGRLLDPYRVRAIGRGLCFHPAGRRPALHSRPVDPRNDSAHAGNARCHRSCDLSGERAVAVLALTVFPKATDV